MLASPTQTTPHPFLRRPRSGSPISHGCPNHSRHRAARLILSLLQPPQSVRDRNSNSGASELTHCRQHHTGAMALLTEFHGGSGRDEQRTQTTGSVVSEKGTDQDRIMNKGSSCVTRKSGGYVLLTDRLDLEVLERVQRRDCGRCWLVARPGLDIIEEEEVQRQREVFRH